IQWEADLIPVPFWGPAIGKSASYWTPANRKVGSNLVGAALGHWSVGPRKPYAEDLPYSPAVFLSLTESTLRKQTGPAGRPDRPGRATGQVDPGPDLVQWEDDLIPVPFWGPAIGKSVSYWTPANRKVGSSLIGAALISQT